ncbi:unnamed protein product [Cuscuta europaea]|uniref:Uncharacterized protein n=1 Tax=Cuscuta europaea TaxID=41803 RepID=A0A9P1ECA4_CUSEU|nr:unnamed protein product [Cuscuta europaea]
MLLHGNPVVKKKKDVSTSLRGTLATLADEEDAKSRASKSEAIPLVAGRQHKVPPVDYLAPTTSIPSISDVGWALVVVPSLISENRDYLISSNLFNSVARSIESHTAGLMDIITAFQGIDRQREGLLHQVDEAQCRANAAEATLSELQLKYGLLQSKYDQLEASSTYAGRQAVAAFQTSPEFLQIMTSRMESHRSEHVRSWLETQEGRLWRAKEVLLSFRCGRYDMQKTVRQAGGTVLRLPSCKVWFARDHAGP